MYSRNYDIDVYYCEPCVITSSNKYYRLWLNSTIHYSIYLSLAIYFCFNNPVISIIQELLIKTQIVWKMIYNNLHNKSRFFHKRTNVSPQMPLIFQIIREIQKMHISLAHSGKMKSCINEFVQEWSGICSFDKIIAIYVDFT